MGPGINTWDLAVMRDMMVVSSLRGTDSTGILQGKVSTWVGRTDLSYTIEKGAHDVHYFQWYHSRSADGNKRILKNLQDNFFCAHLRAATKGAVTDENSHPFEFENLIGMHNGTLRDSKYMDHEKTDSELLFKDINERGLKTVLEELDPDSAYAIVMFDKKNNTLNFVRNDQRTLFFGVHESRGTIYWASEAWMIREMCARNTEKLFKDDIYYFKPHTIYTIHPEEVKAKGWNDFETVKLTPPKKKKYTGPSVIYKNTSVFGEHDGYGGFRGFSKKEDKKDVKLLTPPRRNSNLSAVKPVFNSTTRIPTYHCCACQRRLNLLESFYATKLNRAGNVMICEECDQKIEDIKAPEKTEVILN